MESIKALTEERLKEIMAHMNFNKRNFEGQRKKDKMTKGGHIYTQ